MQQHQRALWELHIAVLLFGGTALFSKLIPLSALDITWLRCAFAALALAIFVKATQASLTLRRPKDYAIALILGILISLHWVTYFAAMQLATVAIGMIAFFSYPVMTVLLEPLLHQQRPALKDIVSGIIVLAGIFLLIPQFSLGNQTTLGVLVGIVSAMLFTARNLTLKRYFSHYHGAHAMLYQTLVAVALLMPFSELDIQDINAHMWLSILLLAIVFTAAPHALFTSALRQLRAKTVGLVSCLQPLYGTLLAWWLLSEPITWQTAIGGTLVVMTALYETAQNHGSQQQKKSES
ncbi:DMT family transporter [Shewanella sp. NIFS-20-20]|uniref:DMT family transporter n=1 Tax=Shewanella sp. NIFS-20-20 TaxID=2853806 RepID=UPI001C46D168|nr:DMT family transporter [Shewanella sp. NIFS-20-20]MBV7317535.1 DMT family transporter [Shewanella sp. NIFS-20-20]